MECNQHMCIGRSSGIFAWGNVDVGIFHPVTNKIIFIVKCFKVFVLTLPLKFNKRYMLQPWEFVLNHCLLLTYSFTYYLVLCYSVLSIYVTESFTWQLNTLEVYLVRGCPTILVPNFQSGLKIFFKSTRILTSGEMESTHTSVSLAIAQQMNVMLC